MQAGSELSDRLGRAPALDEPSPRDGHVRRRWAGKAKMPDQPAQALQLGKSGKAGEARSDKGEAGEGMNHDSARDLREVIPEENLAEPAHVGLTNEANRPRLHRGDERSRGSGTKRKSGRQCGRGPS